MSPSRSGRRTVVGVTTVVVAVTVWVTVLHSRRSRRPSASTWSPAADLAELDVPVARAGGHDGDRRRREHGSTDPRSADPGSTDPCHAESDDAHGLLRRRHSGRGVIGHDRHEVPLPDCATQAPVMGRNRQIAPPPATSMRMWPTSRVFSTLAFEPTIPLPGHGDVPLNVARICQWTTMCTEPDLHANPGQAAMASWPTQCKRCSTDAAHVPSANPAVREGNSGRQGRQRHTTGVVGEARRRGRARGWPRGRLAPRNRLGGTQAQRVATTHQRSPGVEAREAPIRGGA